MKLFGVSPLIQEKEVSYYCFGICGKIIVAGIDDDVFGPLCPCKREDCEYEEKRTDEPVGTIKDIDGEFIDVYIRKLKPLPDAEREDK